MSRYRETSIQETDLMQRYKDRSGKVLKYSTTLYEPVDKLDSDIYVIAQEGDRLDLLAEHFYRDKSLWWFIGRVNNINTMHIPAGTSLRIPASPSNARGA